MKGALHKIDTAIGSSEPSRQSGLELLIGYSDTSINHRSIFGPRRPTNMMNNRSKSRKPLSDCEFEEGMNRIFGAIEDFMKNDTGKGLMQTPAFERDQAVTQMILDYYNFMKNYEPEDSQERQLVEAARKINYDLANCIQARRGMALIDLLEKMKWPV